MCERISYSKFMNRELVVLFFPSLFHFMDMYVCMYVYKLLKDSASAADVDSGFRWERNTLRLLSNPLLLENFRGKLQEMKKELQKLSQRSKAIHHDLLAPTPIDQCRVFSMLNLGNNYNNTISNKLNNIL